MDHSRPQKLVTLYLGVPIPTNSIRYTYHYPIVITKLATERPVHLERVDDVGDGARRGGD